MHYIGADRFQSCGLVKIDHALDPRFAARTARVVETHTDRHPPLSVGNISEVKAEHFAGTQPTIEHQANDGEIASASQLRDKCINLIVGHRAWQPMHLPQPHRTSGWRR